MNESSEKPRHDMNDHVSQHSDISNKEQEEVSDTVAVSKSKKRPPTNTDSSPISVAEVNNLSDISNKEQEEVSDTVAVSKSKKRPPTNTESSLISVAEVNNLSDISNKEQKEANNDVVVSKSKKRLQTNTDISPISVAEVNNHSDLSDDEQKEGSFTKLKGKSSLRYEESSGKSAPSNKSPYSSVLSRSFHSVNNSESSSSSPGVSYSESNQNDGIVRDSVTKASPGTLRHQMLPVTPTVLPVISEKRHFNVEGNRKKVAPLPMSNKMKEKHNKGSPCKSGVVSTLANEDRNYISPETEEQLRNRLRIKMEEMHKVPRFQRKVAVVEPPKISQIAEIAETSAVIKIANGDKHGVRLYMSSDQGNSYYLLTTTAATAIALANLSANTKYHVLAVPADKAHQDKKKVVVHFTTHPNDETQRNRMIKRYNPTSGCTSAPLCNSGFYLRSSSNQKNRINSPPRRSISIMRSSPYSWKVY